MIFSSKNENVFNALKKECSDIENIFDELGLWSFYKALKIFVIDQLDTNKFFSTEPNEKNKLDEIKLNFRNLLDLVPTFLSEENEINAEKILEYSSDKFKKLFEIYLKQKNNNQNFHSIIFVERKSTAYHMDLILKNLAQTETWSFIKSDYISSISGGKKNMNSTQQVI